MPEVFAQLQELDEKRVRNIRNFMVHSANIEKKVFPIINQCLDGIIKAADQINEKEVNLSDDDYEMKKKLNSQVYRLTLTEKKQLIIHFRTVRTF
jgi:hypothetical protein